MACAKRPGKRGCGRLGILAKPVEDLIAEEIFIRVDAGALTEALKPGDDHAAIQELLEVQTRQNELTDMWTAGEISAEQWKRASAGLKAREDKASRHIDGQRRPRALDGIPKTLRRTTWDALPLHRRRAIVELLIESVTVAQAIDDSDKKHPRKRSFEERIANGVRWKL
jgi:hypothetical protein